MSSLTGAATIMAPHTLGRAANKAGVLKLAATAASGNWLLPDDFKGRWVRILPTGGDFHCFCSENSASVVDTSAAGAVSGAAPTETSVGYPVLSSTPTDMEIPKADGSLFLIGQGSAAAVTVYIWLTEKPLSPSRT